MSTKFVHPSNFQEASIGLGDGFLPRRCRAIIQINDGLVYWHIYTSLGLDGLSSMLINSLWPSDAYMRQYTDHRWFR